MSLFPLSNIMRRSRQKKLLSWEEEPGRRSAAHLLTRTGICLCNAELRTALLYNRLVRFLSEGQESINVAREASFDEAKAQH
jgi:hypothetical protein